MLGLTSLVSLTVWCVRETCAVAEIEAHKMQAATQAGSQPDRYAETRQTVDLLQQHTGRTA